MQVLFQSVMIFSPWLINYWRILRQRGKRSRSCTGNIALLFCSIREILCWLSLFCTGCRLLATRLVKIKSGSVDGISVWFFYWIIDLTSKWFKRRKQIWNKRRSDEDRNLIPLHSIGSRLAGMPFAPTVSEESGHTNLLELDFKHPGYFCGFCNAFNKPCSFTQRERWSRKRWSSPWNC